MRFATDTGGTFTDLVIDRDGALHLFKSPTVPSNPVEGVLNAFTVAAEAFGTSRESLLAQGTHFVHGTTHAINAIVTKRVARTALLVNEGHPDILLLREGGRLDPFDHSVRYPRAFIPRALTFEIPGRLVASGAEIEPLDEAAILAIIEKLKIQKVEAVAVCLLWSALNPAHEERVGELLAQHLPGIHVTLSHALNPSLREYRRAIASSIDASLKPLMDHYVGNLTRNMRESGFSGQVFVLTSQGSMVDADEIRQAPIMALNSGPSMAPVAGARIAKLESELADAVVFDTGGTTFDVSLVRDNQIPFTHETWLGLPYRSDMTGFPSIDVKSVGAGGGSIAWVDTGGVLHVGPQSAGSVPGPVCYATGGTEPTIADAAVTLGYIDPDYFLGGRIKLNKDLARRAIEDKLADPLGLSVEEAALAVMRVWTENMVQAIADITVNQGIDPRKAAIIGGGGAAGLNGSAIATRLECGTLIIPDVGAGLSAAGAAVSDVGRSFRQLFVTGSADFDRKGVSRTLEKLEQASRDFAGKAGIDAAAGQTTFFAEARYQHQVWEIDVPISPARLMAEDVSYLADVFHEEHERVFGFRDVNSHIEVIAWRAQVGIPVGKEAELRIAANNQPSVTRTRPIYVQNTGWTEVMVHDFAHMNPSEVHRGPAIVESRFTCIVIEPDTSFRRSPHGNLVINPAAFAV